MGKMWVFFSRWIGVLVAYGIACSGGFAAVGDIDWSFETGGSVFSSPSMGSDGTIYIGSRSNSLYAVNSDGSEKWSFETGDWVDSSPALSPDETVVYFGSWDNRVYAVMTSNGAKLWDFETGNLVVASPAIDASGNLFFGSSDGFFYSLDPQGGLRWQFYVGVEMDSSPAVAEDGSVYVGAFDGILYAFDNDGTPLWEFPTALSVAESSRRIKSPPTISPAGNIYVGGADGKLYAINAAGEELWNYELGEKVDTGISIAPDESLIVASRNGSVYSLDQDGVLLGESYVGDVFYSTPAVGADGQIYVGAYLGSGVSSMSVLSSSGELLWETLLLDYVDSSPLLDGNGRLYFGGYDGALYAVEAGSIPAKTGWSRFGGDVTNRSLQNAAPTTQSISEGFGLWLIDKGLIGPAAEPANDEDGDGYHLLIEYLAGGDPFTVDVDLLGFDLLEYEGGLFCVFEFNRVKNETEIELLLEQSVDLISWQPSSSGEGISEEVIEDDVFGDGTYEFVRLTIGVSPGTPSSFARLRSSTAE